MSLINISNENLNDITKTGLYVGENLLNCPFEERVFVNVISEPEKIEQTVIASNDTIVFRILPKNGAQIPYPFYEWCFKDTDGLIKAWTN
jgi:hypothetical protein